MYWRVWLRSRDPSLSGASGSVRRIARDKGLDLFPGLGRDGLLVLLLEFLQEAGTSTVRRFTEYDVAAGVVVAMVVAPISPGYLRLRIDAPGVLGARRVQLEFAFPLAVFLRELPRLGGGLRVGDDLAELLRN
jgi:hypothetical protein